MAFKPPCEKLGRDEYQDFMAPVKSLELQLEESKDILAKSAAILSENVLAHCLRAFLPDSQASQSEKAKRRSLLVSQMGKVKAHTFGQEENMLHPVFAEMANLHMKPSS